MTFKERVEGLLKEIDRSMAWMGRQINKSPQAMRSCLMTDNPKIGLTQDISNVFGMTVDKFIKPISEKKETINAEQKG